MKIVHFEFDDKGKVTAALDKPFPQRKGRRVGQVMLPESSDLVGAQVHGAPVAGAMYLYHVLKKDTEGSGEPPGDLIIELLGDPRVYQDNPKKGTPVGEPTASKPGGSPGGRPSGGKLKTIQRP
jgi:hypothetical protein